VPFLSNRWLLIDACRPGKAYHLGATYTHTVSGRGSTTEICNENLLENERIRGEQAFKQFVEGTVRGLQDVENDRRQDHSSSLGVFCRVDVGVFQPKKDGRMFYYVNEVERSLTVGLFRRTSSIHHLSMVHQAVDLIPAYMEHSRAGLPRG